MNIKPSREQQHIIDEFKKGSNLRVITPAGGAKTTTSLLCIKAIEGARSVLFLTYNERLKKEIREKVCEWKLEDTEAHNFHAFACKAFKKPIFTDVLLKKELDNKSPFYRMRFDTLIVDEAQDINNLYFRLIRKIVRTCKVSQIMLIGDPRQSIFSFNGADPDILINPKKYFDAEFDFKLIENFDTYRNNKHTTEFLNHSFLDQGTIQSRKPTATNSSYSNDNEGKVDYWITNIFNSGKIIHDYIEKYGIGEVFILAYSIKPTSKQPLIKVIDKMKVKYGNSLNFFIASDDNKKDVSELVQKNKVSCLTFHKSKGLERKCVIVFGFDQTYDKFYNNENAQRPNPLYVALTRASEKLVLLCSRDSKCYKTVNYERSKVHLNIFPKYIPMKTVINHFTVNAQAKSCTYHRRPYIMTSVTDSVKYLNVDSTEAIIKMAEIKELSSMTHNYECKNNKTISLSNSNSNENGTFEDLSPYYGTVMTLLLAKEKGKFSIEKFIKGQLGKLNNLEKARRMVDSDTGVISKYFKVTDGHETENKIKLDLKRITETKDFDDNILCKVSICLEGLNGYSHKYHQIMGAMIESDDDNATSADEMFDTNFIKKCVSDLSKDIGDTLVSIEDIFGKKYNHVCPKCRNEIKINFDGVTDIISNANANSMREKSVIYEIKTKNGKLSEEDILQSILYSSMLNLDCILFNVQTGEKLRIRGSRNTLEEFIK